VVFGRRYDDVFSQAARLIACDREAARQYAEIRSDRNVRIYPSLLCTLTTPRSGSRISAGFGRNAAPE
jgi:hypothetical protein